MIDFTFARVVEVLKGGMKISGSMLFLFSNWLRFAGQFHSSNNDVAVDDDKVADSALNEDLIDDESVECCPERIPSLPAAVLDENMF